MDPDLKMWFIVFVVATVVSVTIQLIHFVALCYVARRLQAKLKEFELRAQSQASLVEEYRTTARELLEALKRSLDNAVEVHRARVYAKLGVRSAAEVATLLAG